MSVKPRFSRPSWAFLLLVVSTVVCGHAQATEVELTTAGARKLSPLPEVGVHPRVFFTEDEYPLIRQRLSDTEFAQYFDRSLSHMLNGVRDQWSEFATMDFSDPTVEALNQYVTANEQRNQAWGVASVYAVVFEDDAMKELMTGVIVNYAKLLLASKERMIGGDLVGLTGTQLNKSFNLWTNDGFGVGVSWTIGAAGYAVSYDVLYNHMTEDQRAIVRKAIAESTTGRQSYGMGMAKGFAASNHYGYHGDLAALLAAIEGEEGFDQDTYDRIKQVLLDYWEVGFTPSGACHEDAYGPNLGLRAGSRGLIALARRGHNIFDTQKYRNFMNYYVTELEPAAGGKFIGGASGGPYDTLYPTCAIVMRYMYPESPAANYVYRYTLGDDFERGFKWQGWLDYTLYGGDWQGDDSRQAMLEATGIPLTTFYPVRGKQVFRSDWSEDALQFTLDARSDAFYIGHDRVSRGNFTMSALGRMWASAGDFRQFDISEEHSLIHIDGKAQAWKAPSVRFLWQSDGANASLAVADLKYAYDWEWSPPWPAMDAPHLQSWERELSSAVDLGWPEDYQPEWLPQEIFGSETGYAQPNGMRRRPYNEVEQAVRASIAVRGLHPFVIVADDIKKDRNEHTYTWYMQVPTDLEVKQQQGRDLILGEEGVEPVEGERCLLVRVLQAKGDFDRTPQEIDFNLESYVAHFDGRRNVETLAKRLTFSVESRAPEFRVMLYPFRVGEALPKTTMAENAMRAEWADQDTKIYTKPDPEKGLLIKIK